MEKTTQWTKDGGRIFVTQGLNLILNGIQYGNVQPSTLESLGYKQKVIERVPFADLPNHTDGLEYYEQDGKTYFVHYDAEIEEPEQEEGE